MAEGGLMNESDVKHWVDNNIDRLMSMFGIPHWRIAVAYRPGSFEDEFVELMRVSTRPEYERSMITINFYQIQDFEELESTLKHELMHILHSPFYSVHDLIENGLGDDHPLLAVIDEAFRQAGEMTVRNLERMHFGHCKALSVEGKPKAPDND
jgi:hypothetical protein